MAEFVKTPKNVALLRSLAYFGEKYVIQDRLETHMIETGGDLYNEGYKREADAYRQYGRVLLRRLTRLEELNLVEKEKRFGKYEYLRRCCSGVVYSRFRGHYCMNGHSKAWINVESVGTMNMWRLTTLGKALAEQFNEELTREYEDED